MNPVRRAYAVVGRLVELFVPVADPVVRAAQSSPAGASDPPTPAPAGFPSFTQ